MWHRSRCHARIWLSGQGRLPKEQGTQPQRPEWMNEHGIDGENMKSITKPSALAVLGAALCAVMFWGIASHAQSTQTTTAQPDVVQDANAPALQVDTRANFAYITDFETGKLLVASNPDQPMIRLPQSR